MKMGDEKQRQLNAAEIIEKSFDKGLVERGFKS